MMINQGKEDVKHGNVIHNNTATGVLLIEKAETLSSFHVCVGCASSLCQSHLFCHIHDCIYVFIDTHDCVYINHKFRFL